MEPRINEELVLRAERGDPKARLRILRRHLGSVWGLALYRVGDPVQAAEITRKVFVKVLSDLSRLPDPRKLRSWIHDIACGMIRLTARGGGGAEGVPASGGEGSLEKIRSLPQNLRHPAVLRYFEGLSYEELSSALGTSPDGVDQLLRRAKDLVRQRSRP